MTWLEWLLCSIAVYLAVWMVLCGAVSIREDVTWRDRLGLLAWLPVIVWVAICLGFHGLSKILEMIDPRRVR